MNAGTSGASSRGTAAQGASTDRPANESVKLIATSADVASIARTSAPRVSGLIRADVVGRGVAVVVMAVVLSCVVVSGRCDRARRSP